MQEDFACHSVENSLHQKHSYGFKGMEATGCTYNRWGERGRMDHLVFSMGLMGVQGGQGNLGQRLGAGHLDLNCKWTVWRQIYHAILWGWNKNMHTSRGGVLALADALVRQYVQMSLLICIVNCVCYAHHRNVLNHCTVSRAYSPQKWGVGPQTRLQRGREKSVYNCLLKDSGPCVGPG